MTLSPVGSPVGEETKAPLSGSSTGFLELSYEPSPIVSCNPKVSFRDDPIRLNTEYNLEDGLNYSCKNIYGHDFYARARKETLNNKVGSVVVARDHADIVGTSRMVCGRKYREYPCPHC
ncbi:hypothetical protein PPACK8108_LOCUS6268 [Phakopsora pachyrhizi]|uniref:Uncharacterized protein n=1 Tax=Phakopsora pachyrhizi TaxID=170000 RepID=A0AAV0ATE4_PHAPC|nr:hypothetical protein PPACK8108_LOCUS6268 [Phakopsora pachyrhizi]